MRKQIWRKFKWIFIFYITCIILISFKSRKNYYNTVSLSLNWTDEMINWRQIQIYNSKIVTYPRPIFNRVRKQDWFLTSANSSLWHKTGASFFFLLTQRMPLILAPRVLYSRPGSLERFRRYSCFILGENDWRSWRWNENGVTRRVGLI